MQLHNTIFLTELKMDTFWLKRKAENLSKKRNFEQLIVINININ